MKQGGLFVRRHIIAEQQTLCLFFDLFSGIEVSLIKIMEFLHFQLAFHLFLLSYLPDSGGDRGWRKTVLARRVPESLP